MNRNLAMKRFLSTFAYLLYILKMKQTNTEKDTPKVSVIIPVYNTEKYVQLAIESICQQTLNELEIIIVDDGSTDRSPDILHQLAEQDHRIQVYKQKNQGPSVTRNTGMEYAKGQYIYFMDSDDRLETNALELCYQKCETEYLDFVFFDAENFSEEITENLPALTYSHTKELEDKTYGGCEMLSIQVKKHQFTPSPCLNFIRRSFLQKHALKFYPHILHEDQLFTSLLYLQAQNVGFIKRNLFHRRLRPSSIMTSRFAWKNMSSYLTIVYELNYFGQKQSHEIQKTIHRFLSQMFDAAVWQAHALPLQQRIKLLILCLTKYRKYVTPRTLAVLMMKRKK